MNEKILDCIAIIRSYEILETACKTLLADGFIDETTCNKAARFYGQHKQLYEAYLQKLKAGHDE